MREERIGNATLYLGTMEDTISGIGQVSHIFTDPPYGYIKTHYFDRKFDEKLFFENAKRLLPDDGFIALFGRGASFYRWNTLLAELGFVFKEEIIWDKRYTTAPCIALSRLHETVSIHTKKTGKIRRSKVPYVEQKQFDIESIVNDIKRIKSAIKTEAGLNKVLAFLQGGALYEFEAVDKHCISQQPGIKKPDRASATINAIKNGMNEKSIVYYEVNNKRTGTVVRKDFPAKDRAICTIEAINEGMKEKSILHLSEISGGTGITVRTDLPQLPREIKTLNSINIDMREKSVIRLRADHHNLSHPTEKPVRLAERILALISDPGDTIYDPFMGSGSFGVACIRSGRKYIGSEMIPEYFDIAFKRIKQAVTENSLCQT